MGREARGHRFFFWPSSSRFPALSLSRFSFTRPPLPQNSRKPNSTQKEKRISQLLLAQRLLAGLKKNRTYAAIVRYHVHFHITKGTVWSHREPTVQRSSPAQPRSWQAPSPCPGRAGKRYALYPYCHYTILLSRMYIHTNHASAQREHFI